MSIQPPKIDNRSYDDIVKQTVKLAQHFTADTCTTLVERTSEALQDRILAEDIIDIDSQDNNIIAKAGESVDLELANKIAKPQLKAANLVKVRVEALKARQESELVKPIATLLQSRTLDENIIDIDGHIIAKVGESVDQKLAEKIAKLKTQLVKVKGWQGRRDAGMALISIFGRMAELVSDRLNQVPEKNFLKFLDLIGTQILPPQPARVPLTFNLVKGSSVDALVPAGTQIAASPMKEEDEEVVFETEQELVVVPAQLTAVFVREPSQDKYSDRTLQATGKKDAAFEAFAGEQPIEHCLYLACDELFALPGNKTVTLKFDFTEEIELTKLPISWSYWDGSWRSLLISTNQEDPKNQVTIENLPVPTRLTINGREARWLRVSLESSSLDENAEKGKNQLKDVKAFIAANNTIIIASDSNNQEDCQITQVNDKIITIKSVLKNSYPKETSVCISEFPIINGITVSTDINSYLTPDFCFFNTVPIDLSKDFYPFGEQPRFNDTLYIAIPEVLAKPNVPITVKVDLSIGLNVKTDSDVQMAWEVWNGSEWEVKKHSSSDNKPSATNFTKSDNVSLILPESIGQTIVNGESRYWIRVRIVNKGNYGTGTAFNQSITFTTLTEEANSNVNELKVNSVRGFMADDRIRIGWGSNTHQDCEIAEVKAPNILIIKNAVKGKQLKGISILLLSESNFEPPSIKSIKLNGTQANLEFPLSACQTYNDFIYVNHIAENGKIVSPFVPFALTADKNPALYLGFDKKFAHRPTTLFAQVEPPQPEEASKVQTSDTEPVRLVWEYASPSGWSSLGAKDETNAFAERGLIQFIGPTDLIKTSEFGQELYWLRVCWKQGQFRVPPRLRQLLTNTMWGTQTTTLENEILGSSNGNPNQIFRTVQKPVLPGQQLEVEEAKIPSFEEKAAIKSEEGKDVVKEVRDEAGQIEAVWVRWHKVRDFYASGARDRHYVLDRLTGKMQFGDGQYGMIPPQGRNNIRLSQYQTGGGTRGNLAANTIVQLKTTIPYIDSVTNLEAAGGGSEQESLEQVKERGPKWLRHRDRAVTIQDFEDLAYEASSDVARAKAIQLKFNPIQMEWIPIFHLSLSGTGDIKVTSLTESQQSQPIYVEIYGTGKAISYAEGKLNNENNSITYKVTPEEYNLGKEWTVILTNEQKEKVTQAVEIVYPTGSITENLQIPPKNGSSNKHNPYQNNAEVVELILVPHNKANQPTPSIALLNQVKQYICDRSSPALQLQVTEPHWVEVSVTATIVPVSWESADQVKAAALNRLQEFLHPLTGGKKRQGWEFGRYPYESDLYAALEEIKGVDYVESLSIQPKEFPSNRPEQCLIFSGSHQVSLGGRTR